MRSHLRRLARWLPPDAARDSFTPALHDLEAEWAARRCRCSWLARVVADLRLAGAATLLWLDCVRLSAVAQMAGRRGRRAAQGGGVSRKEALAMIFYDLRHALRLFRREPGFASAAVLTLALGIGANVALFAVVEAVLLRPLPFEDAEQLVMLRHRDLRTGITKEFVALGDVVDLRARQASLEALVAFGGLQSSLLGEGDPMRIQGIGATPELFRVLRVEPVLGRFLEPDDLREGAPEVVVISHQLWTTTFGSNRDVVGRSILMGATRRLIVGVAPRGLRFPPAASTDVIIPMRLPSTAPAERRAWIHAMGRLHRGVAVEEANTELAAVSRAFEAEFPATNRGVAYDLQTLRDFMVGDTRRPLVLMLAAVGFVLLIACANVGNLLLARLLARRQELSVRLALGAGRRRLASQVLVEGLVLSAAGTAVGVLIASQAAPAVAAIVPQARQVPGLAEVAINVPVLAFACTAALVSALLFSSLAAFGLTGSAADVAVTRRASLGAGARRAASTLVAVEVALAAVLLVGAGLTLRSVASLVAVDPGFRPEGVFNLQMALPPGRYPDAVARRAFYDRAFAAIRTLPGVEAVGAGVVTPLTGNNWTMPLERPERPLARGERAPDVGWQLASKGYFEALKVPLRAGRLFDDRDGPEAPRVVIISEGLAARHFVGENPVGRRVRLGQHEAEIIGVVGDIRRAALADQPRPDMYLPFERDTAQNVGLFIRAAGDPLAVLPSVRETLRRLEPNVVVYGARSMEEVAAESAAVARLAMRLLGGFAGVSLALAAIGIYGVMSYAVRRRARELGTRIALGANRAEIVRLVLGQAAAVAGIGTAIGLAVSLMAARSLGTILYGVPPRDPLSIAAAVIVLFCAALGAAYVPARRAARIDPARTLMAAD